MQVDDLRADHSHSNRRRLALELVYRGLTRTDELDRFATAHAERLAAGSELIACRVVIQAPTIHHAHGQPFRVRLELVIPTGRIAIDHEPGRLETHIDARCAIHDAFVCAKRQLHEVARCEREEPRRRHRH